MKRTTTDPTGGVPLDYLPAISAAKGRILTQTDAFLVRRLVSQNFFRNHRGDGTAKHLADITDNTSTDILVALGLHRIDGF